MVRRSLSRVSSGWLEQCERRRGELPHGRGGSRRGRWVALRGTGGRGQRPGRCGGARRGQGGRSWGGTQKEPRGSGLARPARGRARARGRGAVEGREVAQGRPVRGRAKGGRSTRERRDARPARAGRRLGAVAVRVRCSPSRSSGRGRARRPGEASGARSRRISRLSAASRDPCLQ